MTQTGLVTGHDSLLAAAIDFFEGYYENPHIWIGTTINAKLGWSPSLHFNANDHLIIAAETSDTPYPRILQLRHAAIMELPLPIAVYSVCPEEAFLKPSNQNEIRDLLAHGFGLITVDATNAATRRNACIPLIQHIPRDQFLEELSDLPKKWRVRLRESYDKYLNNAVSGVRDVGDVFEGAIHSAVTQAAKKGWVPNNTPKKAIADALDALAAAKQCKPVLASIGGARNFYKHYRNPTSHFAKTKKDAHKKYRNAQHGFRDGVKQLGHFRTAFKGIGINVNI